MDSRALYGRFGKFSLRFTGPSAKVFALRLLPYETSSSQNLPACLNVTESFLVTGGAGYIGSHICKALAESGVVPICYDTLEKGHEWAVRWGPLERGNIGDSQRLQEVFDRYRPTTVIHLAGYIEVGESVREPERYFENNSAKSGILIETALRNNVGSFVFSSTCAVYGKPRTDLLSETHPIGPLSPYAESKARVERTLAASARRGLKAVSLRYFNATAADADGEIGEAHFPESHLLPLAVDAALGIGPPLTLHGNDYPTPDGSCVRDYVHVSDLAQAHLKALQWLRARTGAGVHEAFNIGSGTGNSVKQVIAGVGSIVGHEVPHSIGPRRPGDSPKLVGDISKARLELDWSPKRDLAKQLDDTVRWRRKMPR